MKIKNIKFETPTLDVKAGVNSAKKIVRKANDTALEITEDIVEGTLARGPEWQNIAEKSVKGGLKLMAKQQDMVFDSLEIIKGEFVRNRKRFVRLFSDN